MDQVSMTFIDSFARTLAIVATLFYVARQIRITSNAVRANSFQSLASTLVQLNTAIMADESMTETLRRSLSGEPLSDAQRMKYLVHLAAMIRVVESAHYQLELGVLDPRRIGGLIGTSALHLRSEVGRQYWDSVRRHYDTNFQRFVDETVASASGDQASRVLDGGGGTSTP